jgi:hypothetical protein
MGIKEHTQGYQNCHPRQILIFGGHLKMLRGTLYTQISIWANFYLLGVKVFAWYTNPNTQMVSIFAIDPYLACTKIRESLI